MNVLEVAVAVAVEAVAAVQSSRFVQIGCNAVDGSWIRRRALDLRGCSGCSRAPLA